MATYDAGMASGYILRLSVVVYSQDPSGAGGNGSSNIGWSLVILKGSGSGKWISGTCAWSVTIQGVQVGSGTIGGYDFRNYSQLVLANSSTWFAHDSAGNFGANVAGVFDDNNTYGELGDATASGVFYAPSMAKVPPAPDINCLLPNPDQITTTSMRVRFCSTGDGGSPITSWGLQYAKDAAFTNPVLLSSTGTSTVSGLDPGTTYYFRARGQNGVGVGPWSATVSAATLNTTPPLMTVTASPGGSSADLQLTPPGGLQNPTSYVVERRALGSTAPVTTITIPGNTPMPYTVTGLTPGASYEWRSAVIAGGYQSDWGAWLAVQQPNPNTNPGAFFDGSTVDTPTIDYAWTGTANNSVSTASGKGVKGWMDFAAGAVGVAGAPTGATSRQTAGRSQGYANRVVFFTDAAGAGFKAGMTVIDPGRADVAAGGIYWGSVYVQIPSRSQRLAAFIVWTNAAGVTIGSSTVGDAVVVPAGSTDWTRLTVKATAPAGAEWGAVQVIDVTGTGWAAWHGGDIFTLDDAMLTIGELYPYFDGATPDTPEYDYSWLGTVNESASQRTSIAAGAGTDPFADPDCDPIPLPPRPPVVDTDCITEVGSWRRYWAVIAPENILDWISDLPTVTVSTGAAAARQVRIRLYENPDEVLPDQFSASTWISEQIISYMPARATYVLNGVDEQMSGSSDGGLTWTNLNHLLYGTGATPASWPVLQCGGGYLASFDVPLDAPAGNLTVNIELTRRY